MKTYMHFCACVQLSLNTYWKKKNVSNKSCRKKEIHVYVADTYSEVFSFRIIVRIVRISIYAYTS
jgi:hypothetical protein